MTMHSGPVGRSESMGAVNAAMWRAVRLGGVAAAVIAVVAAVVGLLIAGPNGALSGIIGAASAFLFLGVTAVSLMVAGRFPPETSQIALIGGLVGGWFVKVVVFVVAVLLLRQQTWIVGGVLAAAIIATVMASLVIDVVVVSRARIPIDVSSH